MTRPDFAIPNSISRGQKRSSFLAVEGSSPPKLLLNKGGAGDETRIHDSNNHRRKWLSSYGSTPSNAVNTINTMGLFGVLLGPSRTKSGILGDNTQVRHFGVFMDEGDKTVQEY